MSGEENRLDATDKVTGSSSAIEQEQEQEQELEQEYEWVDEENPLEKKNIATRKPKLHFVSETGTARPRGVSRNLIRSHARRNPSLGKSTTSPSSLAPNVRVKDVRSSVTPAEDNKKITERTPKAREIQIRLPSPGTIIWEPFDSLPLGSNKHMQALLNHWDTVFRHSYAPASPRERWLPFAVSDALILNIVLLITALNRSGLRGLVLTPDVLYYKGHTIKMINERFRNPAQFSADATICAVASMAHLENLAGTPEGAKMHIDGLETMINAKGGFGTIDPDNISRRLSAWADSAAAVVLGTKPRFPHILLDIDTSHRPRSSLAIRYTQKLINLTGFGMLSAETISIYWSMHNLMRLKDTASSMLISNPHFGDIQESIERRLIAIIQNDLLITPTSSLAIYSVFSNAAMIHCYGFMRDLALSLPWFNRLSRRIRSTLTHPEVHLSVLKVQYPEMLLWVLMMGGIGGAVAERVWFGGEVADFGMKLGVHGGNEIALMLGDFLWSKLYRSPATIMFWNEVAKRQGFEDAYGVRKPGEGVELAIFNVLPIG